MGKGLSYGVYKVLEASDKHHEKMMELEADLEAQLTPDEAEKHSAAKARGMIVASIIAGLVALFAFEWSRTDHEIATAFKVGFLVLGWLGLYKLFGPPSLAKKEMERQRLEAERQRAARNERVRQGKIKRGL